MLPLKVESSLLPSALIFWLRLRHGVVLLPSAVCPHDGTLTGRKEDDTNGHSHALWEKPSPLRLKALTRGLQATQNMLGFLEGSLYHVPAKSQGGSFVQRTEA